MVDILISIASKVAEYTVAPIGRQLGYLFCYKQNVDDLTTQIDGLRRAKERLQHQVDQAKRNGEIIEADVNHWFAEVNEIIDHDQDFTRHEEQANSTKCSWVVKFPNLVSRHRLSRRAKKMAKKVATQIQAGNNFKQVSYRQSLPSLVGNKGYEGFESRNQILTNVLEALRDPSVRMVGVWGMGGVGKTMLAKEVARRAKDEEKLFTEVVFTTISKDQNIEKIQQEIGEKLGMSLSEGNKDVRRDRLQNRLKQENKILIIVDDIWDELDLEDVGISFGIDQKGCKILLTTRSYHVLANDMGVPTNVIFAVEDLSEHESMSLFYKIVGNQAERHDDDFRDLATQIVEECGGLPIAITTVASALKNKDYAVWKNALQELKNSNPINIKGMHQKVYTSIKLSYDALESEEAKLLLLLCSLFEEDANIHTEKELCNYGIGLNLFEGVNTLEEARNKMVTLVTNLKDHSLLLNGDDDDRVKLHDVIRDVVIFIASKLDDHHRMHNIRNADELEKYVNKEMLKDSTAISMYDIKADQYPQTLKIPELNFLRLVSSYGEEDSGKLPHQFFEVLNKLLVLDSVRVSLESLPTASSFCLFPNLQTLRLTECILGDISWIGELKNLKILDLSFNSSITELPRGIGKLNRLLSLNLEGCHDLKVIERNVISSLTRLEELNLKDSFTNWEVDGVVSGDERRNANLSEVKNLPHLINLNLEVPDINSVPKAMFSEQLKKYYVSIGADEDDFVEATSRTLKLKLCPKSILNEHDFEALLITSEALYLNGFKSVKSLAFEIDSMGFKHLKHLTVEESTEIRCIVNSNNGNMDYRPAAFPSLESLVLGSLMSLENIVHGKLTTETSFGKLKEINVENCDKLKSLFPLFNIPRQLESIEVSECTMMEEIISHHGREGDHVEKNEFSQLQSLSLSELPKLVQFIATRKSDEIKSEGQSIDDSVAPLFNGQVLFPELDNLFIRSLNIQKIWNDDQLATGTSFGKLTEIQVWNCKKLKSLFSLFNIPRQLKSIKVDDCKMMEEIITHHGREGDRFEKIEISQLQSLLLSKLPKLAQFITTSKSDEIKSDDSVMALFNEQVLFPELNSLSISSLNIQKIWNNDQLTTETSFGKLTEIEVSNCKKLKSLFSLFNISRQLKSIHVRKCTMIEEIITHHRREGDHVEKIEFSQLQNLFLIRLPKLVQFIATSNSDEIKSEGQSIDESVEALFNGQVVFPKLNLLFIFSLNIRKIWNDNQLSSSRFGFQNLTEIYVRKCDHLKGLIPSSMSASLVHLRSLTVNSCEAMKEIFFIGESAQVMGNNTSFPKLQFLQLNDLPNLKRFCAGNFSFPRLVYLRLNDLPNLKRFCGGDCLDCSSLSDLEIRGCLKLRVFVTNNKPTTTIKKDDENSRGSMDKQHLSHHKDVVKVELSAESSCSEIISQPRPLGSAEEHDDMVFKTKRLSELKLWNLPNLRHLSKTFRTVESLSICEWGVRLKDLATPLMSFQNLKVLTVKDCHGLTSLLSPSTAKSLSQQLIGLGISGCKSLTQVIANDHKEADDDDHEIIADYIIIIFSPLKVLLLDDLSSLTSFYSGNNNVVLQFPHLDNLAVGGCPEMNTFYHGIIDCPSLHQIFLYESDDGDEITEIMWDPRCYEVTSFEHTYWKGDINTTIQKLWEENKKVKRINQKMKRINQKMKRMWRMPKKFIWRWRKEKQTII